MAEQNANEKPEVTFDAASLEKMSSAQHADMLNAMWAQLMLRLEQLEKPKIGAEADQIDIDGDEILQFERIGNKFYGWIELGKLQEQLGPIGAGTSGQMLMGRITDAEPTIIVDARNNPLQWLYQIQQVKPGSAPGFDVWENDDEGYVGNARNAKEDRNNGVGVQGNGFDLSWSIYTDNTDMKFHPIRDLVPFWLIQYQDGTVEAVFSEPNIVGGDCGGSESGSM